MNYRLELRSEVLVDIASAAGWYDSREAGLGDQFTESVQEKLEELLIDPTLPRVRDVKRGLRWVFSDEISVQDHLPCHKRGGARDRRAPHRAA